LIPTFLAKIILASNAFALASTVPNGAWSFFLKLATNFPSWSQTITPSPAAFCVENIAASTLILYDG